MHMNEPIVKGVLDELLADWHRWASGYSATPTYGACPVFKNAKSPRHWDTTGELDDAEIHKSTMETIDFAILGDKRGQGGIAEPHRSALCIYARNQATGRNVWASPRLPQSLDERVNITNEALLILREQLVRCGVL